MADEDNARILHQSATEVLVRAMSEFGETVDRVVVVTLDSDGEMRGLYSNARSEPEMYGMLCLAISQTEGV